MARIVAASGPNGRSLAGLGAALGRRASGAVARCGRPAVPVSRVFLESAASRGAACLSWLRAARSAGGGRLPVLQDRRSRGERLVDGLAASGGQLRGVLGAGQQRLSLFDGGLFCLGCPRPGPQPGATEAVAYLGGGSDEAGSEVRVAVLQGQRAESGQAAGQALEVKHAVNPGEKYGKLTIIGEVRKVAPDGKSYRAVRCRCDCGNELTTALRTLMSGDARSCGCSRGRPKYEWKRCPVCGRRARIRRDRRSCSRACGHKLTGAALRAERPSYDVWHNRVKKARGPASDHCCIDCGGPAADWSTADRSSNDVWVRFQPRCRKCHRRYDGAIGEGSPRAKLTAEKVRRLRARRADGLTYRQLAGEFGISDVSAHAAVNGRTWAHVA